MAEVENIKDTLDAKSDQLTNGSNPGPTFHCDTCGSDKHDTSSHGTLGGRRTGAGGVPGKLKKKTLEAMKVKDAFIQRVLTHADDLFHAQYNLAIGEQVLMVKVREKDSKGKVLRTYFEHVTNVETIKQYLDHNFGENNDAEDPSDDEHFYYLTTKTANNQALDSLMNRAVGKVPEKLEISGGFFSQPTELIIRVIGRDIDERDVIEGEVVDNNPRTPGDDSPDTGAERETEPSAGLVS